MGNPFAEALHDGGTLDNINKYQALSFQFIGTNWSRNFVVSIAFAQSNNDKATKLYELFTSLTIAHTGFDPKDIQGSCGADGADHKVSVLASVEARVCFMHNGDIVGASAVGKLVRTKMKVAINLFSEGNNLISKAHNLATRFLYGSEWYKQLWKLANALYGAHGEWIKLFLDLNYTWIYAQPPLFYSIG